MLLVGGVFGLDCFDEDVFDFAVVDGDDVVDFFLGFDFVVVGFEDYLKLNKA